MLLYIKEAASEVQVQTSSDVPSTSTNQTSTDDSLYTEDGETYCLSPERLKAASASRRI